jgi:heme exporter protein D
VTIFHLFYIPAVFAVGLFIGMMVGKRNTYRAIAEQERQEREREARRAARQQQRQGTSA